MLRVKRKCKWNISIPEFILLKLWRDINFTRREFISSNFQKSFTQIQIPLRINLVEKFIVQIIDEINRFSG